MSQHDFNIANQTASNARADINNALKALATLSSGTTAPSNTYPNMLWYNTSSNILKMRDEADDAWINVGYLDQSNNEFKPYVGGTQVDTQSTATWEAGNSTTEGIVSPAKVKASIEANSSENPVKAWVSFDETGTILASWNVSSVTDNGNGDYTINFSTSLSDDNYAVGGTSIWVSRTSPRILAVASSAEKTASSCRVYTLDDESGQRDPVEVYVSFIR